MVIGFVYISCGFFLIRKHAFIVHVAGAGDQVHVTFLEEQLETPIKIVSVGPDRGQTIERYTEE